MALAGIQSPAVVALTSCEWQTLVITVTVTLPVSAGRRLSAAAVASLAKGSCRNIKVWKSIVFSRIAFLLEYDILV